MSHAEKNSVFGTFLAVSFTFEKLLASTRNDVVTIAYSPDNPSGLERGTPASIAAIKSTLIATISTILTQYFNSAILKSAWIVDYSDNGSVTLTAEQTERRVVEMKARFLYCIKEAARLICQYEGQFTALAAYEEDKVTESLEIISTPEHQFSDLLLNRCTEVMVRDISAVPLSDAICGQFLRMLLQIIRQDLRDPEHTTFVYLFCVWNLPEVLFDQSIGTVVRRREIAGLLADPRLPEDFVSAAWRARGGSSIFKPERLASKPEPKVPVDEGWDLEAPKAPELKKKRGAWARLLSRYRKMTA